MTPPLSRIRRVSREDGPESGTAEGQPAPIPELHEVDVPADLTKEIEDYMERYPDRHSAVLSALAAAQRHYDWCSPEAMRAVAAVMQVTPAYVESVASFYDMFSFKPTGRRKIRVCTNVSCELRGARKVLAALAEATGAPVGGRSSDGEFQLEAFECLGACDIAPMAAIEGHYRGPLTVEDAQQVVDELRAGKEPLPEKRFVGDYGRKGVT